MYTNVHVDIDEDLIIARFVKDLDEDFVNAHGFKFARASWNSKQKWVEKWLDANDETVTT